jgi:hypothetical protein
MLINGFALIPAKQKQKPDKTESELTAEIPTW